MRKGENAITQSRGHHRDGCSARSPHANEHDRSTQEVTEKTQDNDPLLLNRKGGEQKRQKTQKKKANKKNKKKNRSGTDETLRSDDSTIGDIRTRGITTSENVQAITP